MDILVMLAKFVVAVLPFLNRHAKMKGTWKATYHEHDSKQPLTELVELNQLSSLVWGRIKPLDNEYDPTWLCYGIMRDQVLVGMYFSSERLRHWQGSFALCLTPEGDALTGHYCGFEEASQTIVDSHYAWSKVK